MQTSMISSLEKSRDPVYKELTFPAINITVSMMQIRIVPTVWIQDNKPEYRIPLVTLYRKAQIRSQPPNKKTGSG